MRRDRRLIHKLLSIAYHPEKLSARGSFSQKKLNSDDHFDPQFLLMGMKGNYKTKKKGTTMKPLTDFKKTKILRNTFLSLGVIFALATTAHAQNPQNLYVSAQVPPSHAILEFTPDGTQSTYASGLLFPRGLAFDSIGSNLFAAHNLVPDNHVIGRVLKFNLRNHVSTVGSAAQFFFAGLAIDIAGNAYVLATDDTSPTAAGTIFKFTPDGERIIFGSVPGVPDPQVVNLGLAFDSAGNLYATASSAQTIYKFAPDGARTVFVEPSQFNEGEYPAGLAFDSSGNLFVSIETFSDPEAGSIVYFSPIGVKSIFAAGLTTPRGLAFDSSGNLFVAEAGLPETNVIGDILKFPPGGGTPTVFASGFGRPQFLTFGPPR
jgi:sugar lactone lactonase YvrE